MVPENVSLDGFSIIRQRPGSRTQGVEMIEETLSLIGCGFQILSPASSESNTTARERWSSTPCGGSRVMA